MVAKRYRVGQVAGWTDVRAASTANVTIATALNNADVIDGVTLADGDKVLLKDQTTKSENGIYVVAAGPARTTVDTAWATAGNSSGQVARVAEGTANANKGFLQYSEPGVVGTDALVLIVHPLNGKKG